MEFRFRIALLLLVSLVVILVWAFPYWYPFIATEVIAEVFPGLPMDLQDEFLLLSNDERSAFFDMLNEDDTRDLALPFLTTQLGTDVVAPEEEAILSLPNASPIFTGEFNEIDVIRKAEGQVTIFETPDQNQLLRIEDFRSAKAPEIHVILAPPLEDDNTIGVDYIDLGVLKGNVGNQNYTVPPNVDFNRYPFVVLYSQPLDLVISSAPLS